MTRPRISVILPVYNERPAFLRRAVDSIITQTFQDWELILADDGSEKADTQCTLVEYAGQDRRIRLLRLAHRGLTISLNEALDSCRGELVCRHDSDDWSEQDRFERQAAFLDSHRDIALVGSQAWLHQEDGAPLWITSHPIEPAAVLRSFESMNPFSHGSVCFRRDAAHAVGGYHPQFDCSQDYDFFWRLCERFGGANLPQAFYHLRRTRLSVSAQKASRQAEVTLVTRRLAAMRRQGRREDFDEVMRQASSEVSAPLGPSWITLKQGDACLLAGSYREAFGCFFRAICQEPLEWHCYAKLIRCSAFVCMPWARKHLFS